MGSQHPMRLVDAKVSHESASMRFL
jgi:hypothetical protein